MGEALVRARVPWALVAVWVLTIAVFARVVGFPFVNWDDPSHFLDNPLAVHPLARGWIGLFFTEEIGYPAPLLQLSFALDMALFGTHAGFWHAENLALHLTAVTLLYAVARRLDLSAREAAASAALFAVHPLVAEPVSWVTGRKDVLSIVLLFGACLVACSATRVRWVVANVLAFAAVLVLPRMIVAAPFVAVVASQARRAERPRGLASAGLRLAPAFVMALGVIVLGIAQIRRLGAVPPPRSAGQIAGDIFGTWGLQFWHVVFPVDLSSYYFRVSGDPSTLAMATAAAFAIALAWLVATRTKRGDPERTGAILLVVAYAPVSGVFTILRWTSDSYMYLPMAAIALAVVPTIARRWPEHLAHRASLARAIGASAIALYAVTAFGATSRWASSTAVWKGGAARYPNEPLALEHEALGLRSDGFVREADARFIALAERFPNWQDTMDDEVLAYEARGDFTRASKVLERGVRAGSPGCIRMFWMRVLRAPSGTPLPDRELLSVAFEKGFAAMKEGLHDPEAFHRVTMILRSAGLETEAARGEAHLRDAFHLEIVK